MSVQNVAGAFKQKWIAPGSYRQPQRTWRVCRFHQEIRFPGSLASLVLQWRPRGAAGTVTIPCATCPKGPLSSSLQLTPFQGDHENGSHGGLGASGGRPKLISGHSRLDCFGLEFLVSYQLQRRPSSPNEMGSLGQRAPQASSGSCALSPTLPPRATVWAQRCFQSP